MARKKDIYDASISASKELNSQELKAIEENMSEEQKYNFSTAIKSLHQFRDVTKSLRKSIATFDKEQLISYLKKDYII